jgi:hypothetical protein
MAQTFWVPAMAALTFAMVCAWYCGSNEESRFRFDVNKRREQTSLVGAAMGLIAKEEAG